MVKIKFESSWCIEKEKVVYYEGEADKKLETSKVFFDGEGDMNKLLEFDSNDKVISYLSESKGAWSVVFYNAQTNTLFIGRDVFGRLSLVFSKQNEILTVGCSVNPQLGANFMEVPFAQITEINLDTMVSKFFSLIPDVEAVYIEPWIEALNIENTSNLQTKFDLINVSRHLEKIDDYDNVDILSKSLIEHSKRLCQDKKEIGIAFSGGVDSLLVAHSVIKGTSDDVVIIFVNVAFGANEKNFETAPDRARSREAFTHLCNVYPERKLQFLLRNVTVSELEEMRTKFVAKAAAPCASVLDDSIACVIWFALDGKGVDSITGTYCSSNAETIFVGSGADEVFAGYSRHRNRYQKDGHPSVAEECEAELRRLGSRNGGRDSRIATQLKKSLAAPFLSDDIVAWANKLPVLEKCDLSLPRGIGEKRIIREALARLGAPHTAPKQAMQFGSRIAKLTNESKTVKGSDISIHLSSININ